jgi:Ser/Thr protein kinase RdoA (MazF antagonist)
MTAPSPAHPFGRLDPDTVLASVESTGLPADGRLFALNSYENRVYRVGLDAPLDAGRTDVPGVVPDQVVVKFYRPGRWSDAQIEEEHAFGRELAAAELPVAAPVYRDGRSLFTHVGFRFALFECRRGAAPELDAPGARALVGRTLGRVHAIGATRRFRYRESLGDARHGARARGSILELDVVPEMLRERYARVSGELVAAIRDAFDAAGDLPLLRLHGDCHLGNILWDATGPVFVDLDDCLSGPCVQDLWMFLSGGSVDVQRAEWTQLLEGYEQFAGFDYREVALIEPLRALRMLNHSAWLATRWDDPAFPRAFPWFAEPRYWERHVADLVDQLAVLQDPPLLGSC